MTNYLFTWTYGGQKYAKVVPAYNEENGKKNFSTWCAGTFESISETKLPAGPVDYAELLLSSQ